MVMIDYVASNGQCGCGDFDGLVRFAGPDGTTYVLEVYPGYEGCDTGVMVTIYKMDESEAISWRVEDIPEWRFEDRPAWLNVRVVDHELLKAKLDAFHEAHLEEYDIDGFIHDAVPEALRDACGETVDKWRASVKRQGRR
jgi:hypothetical protein